MKELRVFGIQMADIRQDEYYMELCVSTNPHLKGEHQHDLWNALNRQHARPLKTMSDDTRKKKKELERYLKEKRHGI